jgi:hypothetical protein
MMKAEVIGMEKVVTSQPTPSSPTDYEAAIEQCLVEMKRLQAQIDRDQAEIDRLKTETRAMLAQMKAA